MHRAELRGVKIGEERGVKIEKGRISTRFRATVLRPGEKRFGPPDPASRAAIEKVADPDLLPR